MFPALMKPFSKLFDISVLDPAASDFFKQQIEKIINSRETIQQVRTDFFFIFTLNMYVIMSYGATVGACAANSNL